MDDQASESLIATKVQDGNPGSSQIAGASRYFAAAAYHDGEFRQKVLNFDRHRWYRAPAPEFGIDEALVTKHCHRAERREIIRDVAIIALFLMIAYEPIGAILNYPEFTEQIIANFAPILLLALLACGLVVFVERLITNHFTVSRQFAAPDGGGLSRLNSLKSDNSQNLIVYGGYLPFVGSGYGLGGWSFSINLERTHDALGAAAEALPFASSDLLNFLRGRLDRLQIPGLQQNRVLFADGRLVRTNATSLMQNGRVRSHIEEAVVEQFDDLPADGLRSYLCINITDWNGEIVVSVYIRCKKGISNLFIEASYFILPPPKRDFFKIDEADPQLRFGVILRTLFSSVAFSPFRLVAAILRVSTRAGAPISGWLERRRIRRAMKRNPQFNFGAVDSIRQLGMENYFRVYFQQLDKEQHVKTVEQSTIDAIVEFLDLHNIDTSDLRDRRSAILNNGVIVSGGSLNADNMSVGQNAKALVSRFGGKSGSQATKAQSQSIQ